MGVSNNSPTFSYVHFSGVSVRYNGELYMVQDYATNKKYIYYNIDLPYQLNSSNVMPDRSLKQFLVAVNDNGMATLVPSTYDNFSISFDGDSTQAIKDRIFGLYEKNQEFGEKFIAIEQDIDGIRQIVGSGGTGGSGGSGDYNDSEIWEKISQIEQTVDNIDLSVKETVKKYNDDKEINKLREDLNGSIIKLNSSLGTFKSEVTGYFKDNEISNEEKLSIETHLQVIENDKVSVDGNVDKVILIVKNNNQTQDLAALNNAKTLLQTAHNNLKNNITNAVIDNIITSTEYTVITDAFAKYTIRLNEIKNTCDDIILLGLGGVIVEELGKISVKTDEIKLSVSKVESSFKSEMNIQKIELENQINDVSTALDSFENTVNTVFKDGIIDETEKSLLLEKIENIDKEKLDIDTRYNSIYNDDNLSIDIKNDLASKYSQYNEKHIELKEKIEYVILDSMVNDAEKLEINTLFKQYSNALASVSALLVKAIENISLNNSKKELEKAKEELREEISDVRDSIGEIGGVIDGTFQDNVLDEVERRDIQQNLDNLTREKLDIDKTYEELYSNIYLTGQDKINLKSKYDNYISKYNEVVTVSNNILNKEELLNDIDRANLNSAIAKHKDAISLFHTQANKAIDVIATNKVNDAKEEIRDDINDLRSEVGGLNDYIDGTFKDNVIDGAERKVISQNIDTLNREKADIDKTFEFLYSNKYLEGEIKVNLKNSYDDFISKHNETLNVIQGILDKDTLINNADRENMEASFANLNSSLTIFISATNIASDYITNKTIETTKEELQAGIADANDRIDSILDDVGGAVADGIIEQAESIIIKENISKLNKEKLELDLKFETIYNNTDLVEGEAKSNLDVAKKDFDAKITNLINIINELIEDERATEYEKAKLEEATNKYNTSFATLSNCFDICIDSIAKKKADDVSNTLSKELGELQDALSSLEDTMNGTFKDGILSDAEKKAIQQNLKTLESSKLNIDKQYNVIYNNTTLDGTIKVELKNSYDTYITKYNSLVTVVNDILNKDGLLVESDSININNAFKAHNEAMSLYNEKINIAIDYIVKKDVENAKNELAKDIVDIQGALGDLENTMYGAFQDGILTETEKLSIKQHLLTLASEKSDIDKQYATIFANKYLEGNVKTNLTSSYNNYVSAYNSLISTINGILEKEGLIDSVDRNNLNTAFSQHDSKLGLYTVSATDALDYIANKKISDSEDRVNSKISTIEIGLDGITSRVSSVENKATEIDGKVSKQETRLSNAEEKITDKAIINTVSTTIDNKISDATISINDAILNTEQTLNQNIDNAVSDAQNSILQNIADNYATSSDLNILSQTVSSNLTQTDKNIEMQFTTATNYTKEVEGKLQEFENTVGTHIRFSENGIDLGKTNSPFHATLSNEKLAFKQDEEEIAYISNNKMHITNAEILDTLRIGEEQQGFFTWIQGEKGNLSLRWSDK